MKKLIILVFFLSLPYFIYTYFFTPQRVEINEINSGSGNLDPQYIFVRKDPMTCNPTDCSYLWNMDFPEKINLDAINDIYNKIGTHGNSTNTRKVGIGVTFNYFIGDYEKHKQSLVKLLDYSKIHQIPIFINFEGLGWWDKKANLWNWWDPNSPGYNTNNKENVEWTCWDSSCAIKKSWRNWGSEMEVKPQPNLASQSLISDTKSALSGFISPLSDWYNNQLGADQKWLLGGITLGGEVDIGANYYYYPNGQSDGGSLKNSVQLGYAAVKTAGIKSSGTITPEDINEVVRRYQTTLNNFVYDLGIPRSKIFNHNGGKGAAPFIEYPPNVAFETLPASLNSFASPGWSFYGDVTMNPQNYPLLNSTLDQINNHEWSSPEWLPWSGDQNGWTSALRNTLNYRNNRFLNIANWEYIRNLPYALEAIKTVANETNFCWITSPRVEISATDSTAKIDWIKGSNNDKFSIIISTSNEYNFAGTLKNPNISAENNLTTTTITKSGLNPGQYYINLIVDGCNNQRRIVEKSFTITSASNPNSYNGKPIKGTTDINTVYYMEAGKRRAIPDWDTYIYGLGFKAGDEVTLSDSVINSIPLGSPVPPVAPSIFNGKPIKGTTDKNTIYLVENGIKRSYPNEALFLASFTHSQVIQLSDATISRFPTGKDVGDNTPAAKPGDLNGDGKVNIYDYSKLISGYGTIYTNTDFINILANYGK